METFVAKLYSKLLEDTDYTDPESSLLTAYGKKVELVEGAIRKLRKHLSENPFADKAAEINYFKSLAPAIFHLHIHFTLLYNHELSRITLDKEDFRRYLEGQKKDISAFFKEHQELYRYYRACRTDEDDRLFVHKIPSKTMDFLVAEGGFCKNSLILSGLRAYERYNVYLEHEMTAGIHSDSSPDEDDLVWGTTKSEGVEWITLLYEAKVLYYKGEPASLEQLKRWGKKRLKLDLKDFSVIDNINRSRKKSTTPLLDRITKAAKERQDRLNP